MEAQEFVIEQFITALEVIKEDRCLPQDPRLVDVFLDLAELLNLPIYDAIEAMNSY